MSEEEFSYVGQYISGINNLILTSIRQFQGGEPYKALFGLVPVINYIIVGKEEHREKLAYLEGLIQKVSKIQSNVHHIKSKRQYASDRLRNEAAQELFPQIIRELADIQQKLGIFTFDESGKFIDLTGGKRLE